MRTQEEGRMSASIILLLLVLSIPLSYGIVIFSYNFGLGQTQPRPSDVSGVTVISATPEGFIGEDVKAPQENRQDEKQTLSLLWTALSALSLAAMFCPAKYAPKNTSPPSIPEKQNNFKGVLPRRGDSDSKEYRSSATATFTSSEAEESGCSGSNSHRRAVFVLAALVLLAGSASAVTWQYNQSGQQGDRGGSE